MPRFDGTGPRGQGPMTGRGEGYCAVRLPDEPGQAAYGYAGLQGAPVRLGVPVTRPARWTRLARWLRPLPPPHRAAVPLTYRPGRPRWGLSRGFRGRGRGPGRGRGRW